MIYLNLALMSITTGNHVWDQKETANILKKKKDF